MTKKKFLYLYRKLKQKNIQLPIIIDNKDFIAYLLQEDFRNWDIIIVSKVKGDNILILNIIYQNNKVYFDLKDQNILQGFLGSENVLDIISEYSFDKDIYQMARFINRKPFEILLMIMAGLNFYVKNNSIMINLCDVYQFINPRRGKREYREDKVWEKLCQKQLK